MLFITCEELWFVNNDSYGHKEGDDERYVWHSVVALYAEPKSHDEVDEERYEVVKCEL